MKTTEMLLIGGAALVAWTFVQRSTGARLAIVPANMKVTPTVSRAQQNTQDASAWLNVAGQAAALYRGIFGGSSPAAASNGAVLSSSVPAADDTLAVNPPGNIDPFAYETAAWGSVNGFE